VTTLPLVYLLHLLALVAFIGAAAGVWARVNLIAVGLALWMMSLLL